MCHLENGRSETLQVVPASKRLSFAHFGSAATGSERLGATINLHFEGNWMPVLVRLGGRRGGWCEACTPVQRGLILRSQAA